MDRKTKEKVLEGYRRIAFGDVTDPVRLLFCDEPAPRTLKSMDLFSISEIKRPKGGGMEIKFFDRIRALQCMQEMEAEENAPCGFYQAFEEGAKALGGEPQPREPGL